MNPQMDPSKAEAWLHILTDPRFLKMLENMRDTQERIAYEVIRSNQEKEAALTAEYGPANATSTRTEAK